MSKRTALIIKAKDRTISGDREPVVLHLTDAHKRNIGNMHKDASKYIVFPDDTDDYEAETEELRNLTDEDSKFNEKTGAFDMNGNPIYFGMKVKQYVKRLSTSPWWRIKSKHDGSNKDYFLHKRVEKEVNGKGFYCVVLVDVEETKSQREEIRKPIGRETEHRTMDEINYKAHTHLEIIS